MKKNKNKCIWYKYIATPPTYLTRGLAIFTFIDNSMCYIPACNKAIGYKPETAIDFTYCPHCSKKIELKDAEEIK